MMNSIQILCLDDSGFEFNNVRMTLVGSSCWENLDGHDTKEDLV